MLSSGPSQERERALARARRRVSARTALVYLLTAVIWIPSSDLVLHALVEDRGTLTLLQTVKGWAFIIATSLLILWLVRGAMDQQRVLDAELIAAEQRFGSLVRNAVGGIAVLDRHGTITYTTPAASVITGLSPQQLLGRAGLSLVHPLDAAEAAEFLEELADSPNETRAAEMRMERADGSLAWVGLRVTNLLDDPNVGGIVINFNDITDKKLAERELQDLADVLAATSDFVGLADAEGNALYLNDAGRDMLGLEREEPLSGLTVPDLHTARSFETIVSEGIPAALENGVWRGETFLRHRDGREIPVSQVIVAHRSAERPVLFSTIIRDMSEYRQLERSLMEAQKMEAIGKLAGGIAHDFNNLLAVIINFAQLLRDDLPDDSPQAADLLEIEKAGTRGAALVRELLTFARRSGSTGAASEPNVVLPALLPLLDRSLGSEIEMRVDLEEGLAPTSLDDAQIEQLIVNLALNAKDALPGGGRVTLRARNLTLDSTHPGVSNLGLREGPHVCIEVIDNGTGMSEDVRRRAFEPFFTTRGESKTGLGLATVYGAVTGAGGAIAIDSSPQRGTTVRVFLPAAVPEAPPAPTTPSHDHVGKTIVVVEDEDSLRALVQRILERAGYRTLAAGSAIEARELISADDLPDLIITDVMMPGQSGRAFIDELRTSLGTPIRVLYMTGYSEEVSMRTGGMGVAASVLQKPFTAEELLETVDALLGERPA